MALMMVFRPCFTAPTFRTFCALGAGFLAQPGRRTVCGMLTGAGLSRRWSHHRAHRFFSRARWSTEQVSAVLAGLVVDLLVPAGEPVLLAVDDTLFRRSGRTVHAASWFHDGSATGRHQVGFGNNWVIAAIVVRLVFLDRPVALPVGFALVRKGTDAASRLVLARRLVEALIAAVPGRPVQVVADSAYTGKALRGLPAGINWTTRLRANASLSHLAPPRTGKRGRPRLRGERLPDLKTLAAATFTPAAMHRYGATTQVHTAVINCLWYGVFGPQPGPGRPAPRRLDPGLRRGAGQHRLGRHRKRGHRTLRRPLVHRGRDRGRQADHRRRPGPQPASPRSATHRPVRTGHEHLGDLLVRHRGLPAPRRPRRQNTSPLVPRQGPTIGRRHARQVRRVLITAQFQYTAPEPATPEEINILRLAWADIAA